MAVITVHGLSERQTIENIVLQGDTFGSILASVQVDNIAWKLDSVIFTKMFYSILLKASTLCNNYLSNN